MALPVRQQAIYWGIAAAVFLILLWALGSVMLPFMVGGAIAYFLDPVADRLERLGMSRAAATSTITIVAVISAILLALLVVPALVRQLVQLINATPEIVSRLLAFLTEKFPDFMNSKSVVRDTLSALGATIQSRGGALVSTLVSSAVSVINAVVFMVVVPVVAFYLLLDWDAMVARIDALVPREHSRVIRQLGRDIDKVLAGFVRGQVTVCLVLGTYYAVALMFAGLQFGLVVGAIAGLITFIPYIGALVGGTLAIGLALFQFWGDWMHIGMIVGIFAVGQFMEGNIISPKLVGKSVGLHPVWLLFALSAFGSLFGFVGMLVAVPVAASIGVVTRFLMERYTDSPLYHGEDHGPDHGADHGAAAPDEKPTRARRKSNA